MTDFEQLSVFRLSSGAHRSPEDGLCAMEAVAWLEGLPHSDRPACTCPVIAAYVRQLNDGSQYYRNRLVEYLPRLVGTVAPEYERERAEYLAREAWRLFNPLPEMDEDNIRRAMYYAKAGFFSSSAACSATVADFAYAVAADDAVGALALELLEGALAIGPAPKGFSHPIEPRINDYRKMLEGTSA